MLTSARNRSIRIKAAVAMVVDRMLCFANIEYDDLSDSKLVVRLFQPKRLAACLKLAPAPSALATFACLVGNDFVDQSEDRLAGMLHFIDSLHASQSQNNKTKHKRKHHASAGSSGPAGRTAAKRSKKL